MENNKIQPIEQEKQKPFLKRISKIEQDVIKLQRDYEKLHKAIKSLGR